MTATCSSCGRPLAGGATICACGRRVPNPAPGRWLLQLEGGELRIVDEQTELDRMVVEGVVSRESVLFEIGSPTRLGEMADLQRLFDVAERRVSTRVDVASHAAQARAPAPSPASTPSMPTAAATAGTADADSADPFEDRVEHDAEILADDLEFVAPRRRWLARLAGGLALAAAAVGGILWWKRSDGGPVAPVASVPQPSPSPSPARAAASLPPAGPSGASPAPSPPPTASATVRPPPPGTGLPPPAPGRAPSPAAQPGAPSTIGATAANHPPAPAGAAGSGAAVETESRSYADLVKEADRLLERGRTRDAVVLLEKALGLRPGGHEALSGLGYAAFDKGSPARAMSYFRQALRASPAYPPALLGLAEAYELMGDRSKSLEAFRTCAARAPGTPEAATAQRKIQQLARMSQAP